MVIISKEKLLRIQLVEVNSCKIFSLYSSTAQLILKDLTIISSAIHLEQEMNLQSISHSLRCNLLLTLKTYLRPLIRNYFSQVQLLKLLLRCLELSSIIFWMRKPIIMIPIWTKMLSNKWMEIWEEALLKEHKFNILMDSKQCKLSILLWAHLKN